MAVSASRVVRYRCSAPVCDLAGRRRVFRLGVTAFLLTSLACAPAPGATALIVFRAAQGASRR
ncbi:hypothetical protein [Amycolatopsis methanolica]|uniref:hypothetical protein n=1 Tax=Amycolatopsis methanolica TaxID=1814 RepID=UPI0003A5A8ED|nr:hypothetical protein [Amycolatopsis methanolica]